MQIILLVICAVLIIVLFRMLKEGGYELPFVQVMNYLHDEEGVIETVDETPGVLVIDSKMILIDGDQFYLQGFKDNPATAKIIEKEGQIQKIITYHANGEKHYVIDPIYYKTYKKPFFWQEKRTGSDKGSTVVLS